MRQDYLENQLQQVQTQINFWVKETEGEHTAIEIREKRKHYAVKKAKIKNCLKTIAHANK